MEPRHGAIQGLLLHFIRDLTLFKINLIHSCDQEEEEEDLSVAQRQVQTQRGPLVRTEGYHITIQCNVSGYQESQVQNFEWSIFQPDQPSLKIQIISTASSDFPYAAYSKRVQNNEIYIQRIKADSVLLHITKLQKTDEGKYECHTPNMDRVYHGSYRAMMTLADFILHSGARYKQRQASGDVRLDKIGVTSFKLSICKLQVFDQGEFYCEAREWVQDPDKSWYNIAHKFTENTTVYIKPARIQGIHFYCRLQDKDQSLFTGTLDAHANLEDILSLHCNPTADLMERNIIALLGQEHAQQLSSIYRVVSL
ncbi:immunoglobulin superfamily member 2-like [Scyliorhinus canicula]|uniref:immunoglobulin superfamily member 2-like n=1 Tax=Scyliorhinus canicula TaxID=7830 RepID=UPI0018F3CDE3|nr:immunoglobulin superfamily member 2-like [Scyliorhinus canicula]